MFEDYTFKITATSPMIQQGKSAYKNVEPYL